jgi:hypothetical protein
MTYLDNNLVLDSAALGSAISATALTTNYIDATTALRDLARGKNLYALFTVEVAATATNAGQLELQVVSLPVTTLAGLASTAPTMEADDEIVTWTAHGLPAGTPVVFTALTGGTGLTASRPYYVAAGAALTANGFRLATTPALALAGAPDVTISVDATAMTATVIPQILGTSGNLAPTMLTVGSQIAIRLNHPMLHSIDSQRVVSLPNFRYMFGRYVVTGTIAAVEFRVELVEGEPDGLKFYPSGVTIS